MTGYKPITIRGVTPGSILGLCHISSKVPARRVPGPFWLCRSPASPLTDGTGFHKLVRLAGGCNALSGGHGRGNDDIDMQPDKVLSVEAVAQAHARSLEGFPEHESEAKKQKSKEIAEQERRV